jgi:hypothetical protein
MNPYLLNSSLMRGRPASVAPVAAPKPAPAPVGPPIGYRGGAWQHPSSGYTAPEPYVAPEPIVQALRQKSLNPEGIRRNANTFKGTTNAPVAPEGKTNPSGANRSAQVTSQV